MSTTCLVTGATGFVGGHLSESILARGWNVRTIARPQSQADGLIAMGVDVRRGDLADPVDLAPVLEGVEVVVHCAAKVGDWGPIEDYRKVNVEGLRCLLDGVRGRSLRRFVHISSLGVYEARNHYGTDENEPLPQTHVDSYTQTKVEAEQLALKYFRDYQIPIVVLRPGFIYGPRDRTVLPQLIANLKSRLIRWIGGGRGALNTIYVGNLVDAILLALDRDGVLGEVFNLTDGESVSKRRFIEGIVQGLALPSPRPVGVPLWLARPLANWLEGRARRSGATTPPLLTQARVKFLGSNLDFSIAKARRVLGYSPRFTFQQGLEATLAWYRNQATAG